MTIIKSMHNAYQKEISLLIINHITDNIPFISFDDTNLNIPENITLADPTFNSSSQIDLLIGASMFWELLCVGQIRIGADKPILQKSKFGWLFSGPIQLNLNNATVQCNLSTIGLERQLEKFWKIEEFIDHRELSLEENQCEQVFIEKTKLDESGRFIIELPTRESFVDFGNTRDSAKKHFLALEKRLGYNADLKQQYTEFMREYQAFGHMTKITDNDMPSVAELDENKHSVYYLPHHSVLKEASLTTKLRVVFDASAKSETGLSLNYNLLTGPTI
ncbi:uncharacterized protein LOC108914762 [Anoplophora glabripennis]|uniref:uncharacterized protein LOC108914762 n=1 Tax=Anoplophora glabripennis TaxID=217634 RepID=UPI00087430FE|nr:uncharacterized protein LOC108914762 [Anoplophora glabripennis]